MNRRRTLQRTTTLALLASAIALACSLNPQPLPPDTFTADAAAGTPSSADSGAADAGGFSSDAGKNSDGSVPPAPDDGGSDAPADAPTDAPDGDG